MAASSSRLAYNDCFEIMDKALADIKGIKVRIPDYGSGNHYRLRLHMARTIDRQDNRDTYPEGHKLYGRSIYDSLVVRIRKDAGWWMFIEKFSTENLHIEPLGGDNVISESTNGNLREAEGGSPPQREGEEGIEGTSPAEEEITIFDAEEEKGSPAVESLPPIQAWRRV